MPLLLQWLNSKTEVTQQSASDQTVQNPETEVTPQTPAKPKKAKGLRRVLNKLDDKKCVVM